MDRTLPAWVKEAASIGFSIIVAIWFMWRADGALGRIEAAMLNHETAASQSRLALLPLVTKQIELARTICRHAARSEVQMQECND